MPDRSRGMLLVFVAISSFLASGCVAPLLAGAAAGAGVFGVNEGIAALTRRELADDNRLRHVTAASLQMSSEDIPTISDKEWHGDVLHWIATTRTGDRFRCEAGHGSGFCTPVRP